MTILERMMMRLMMRLGMKSHFLKRCSLSERLKTVIHIRNIDHLESAYHLLINNVMTI